MDLGGIAHLAAIKSRVPFLHFFDGFRTSHEIQKIEVIEYEDFAKLLDMEAVQRFRDNALNPERPVIRGTAQNPDIFFQGREAANKFYQAVPAIVQDYMDKIGELTGRKYKLFDYVGDPEAEHVIIAMGSVCETIEETITYLRKQGRKVGLVKVRLYRPFAPEYLKAVMPKTVKRIAVLERTKEPGSIGDPLYLDVKTMYFNEKDAPEIYGGRYGLGSKDTTPGQILAVYENLAQDEPKDRFTIGIVDDVTNSSLKTVEGVNTEPESTIRCKLLGIGSGRTVGANKNAIKIIGDKTDLYAQGYFLRFKEVRRSYRFTSDSERKDKSTYLVNEQTLSCHNQAYVNQQHDLKGLKKAVLSCLTAFGMRRSFRKSSGSMKRYIAQNDINFYTINAKDRWEVGSETVST